MRVVQSPLWFRYVDDWSRVRSPSRAARRLRLGHRQNIARRAIPRDIVVFGNTIVCHPVQYRIIEAMIKEADAKADKLLMHGHPDFKGRGLL